MSNPIPGGIACDVCGTEGPTAASRSEARVFARNRGWARSNMKWRCPDCRALAQRGGSGRPSIGPSIHVAVPADTYTALVHHAAERDQPMSASVRSLLGEALAGSTRLG